MSTGKLIYSLNVSLDGFAATTDGGRAAFIMVTKVAAGQTSETELSAWVRGHLN